VALALSDVLGDPARVRRVLQDELFGVTVDRVLLPRQGGIVIDLTFAALPELASAGYEPERARVSVRPSGDIYAFPLGPERTWHHRNPSPLGPAFGHLAGDLCLWYPNDPRSLRWGWADGLEEYVTRVHRHLLFEQYYRREQEWPVEDAPHGDPSRGRHPIRSALMRREERRWRG
jgi:hypothetical protein